MLFEWLWKACNEQNRFALDINADPFYRTIRSEGRFADLLRFISSNRKFRCTVNCATGLFALSFTYLNDCD
ncbi:MAG: hypothetical protein DMG12_11090 [Acidobacteria bacterium]|nr:MAG: hypothetical protein DMG12_11090 [Acidobacteriota bacterium]